MGQQKTVTVAGRIGFMRSFIAYLGPALITSVAYMDPGNYGTDISGGASFGYSMLWIVWLAGIMAMLLQYLSGKVGIATGHSLPELMRIYLKKRAYILPYWLASEVTAAMTDLAEFLGTVIALKLLFNIPLIYGTFLSVFDVILILGITRGKARRLEYAFLVFISIIGIGYFYEIFITGLNLQALVSGSLTPNFSSTSRILLAVGVIGATVMPHALFIHSALANDKVVDPSIEVKRFVLKLHTLESLVMFTFAGLVNAAIMIMAASAFYSRGIQVATIENAFMTLAPLFGGLASFVFAVTLLASGLSSSTTGTLAGQAIMEGMLGRRMSPWIRRVVTRVINTIPTTIAILSGIDPLQILVYSQVALSLMLALPMLPLWRFTSDRRLMGVFVNRLITTVVSGIFILIILTLNVFLLYVTFTGKS